MPTLVTGVYAPLPRYGISHFPLWLFYTAVGAADLIRRADMLVKRRKT